jgi:hypothetical protein
MMQRCGVSSLIQSKTLEKNAWGFPKGAAGFRGAPAIRLDKPMVASNSGGLTCHGGNPVMSKPSGCKTIDFEIPGGLNAGEDHGTDLLEQQTQGARPP